jgi:hypothetical protein
MSDTKTRISPEDAKVLGESFSLEEVLESFEIVSAGTATVAARAARPVVEPNVELIATAKALFEQGHEASDTKKGRKTSVLGKAEGLSEYSIVVYKNKDAA